MAGQTPATYRLSESMTQDGIDSSRHTISGIQRESFLLGFGPGGQRQTEMKLLAVEPDDNAAPEQMKDYQGRIRTWPGLVLLVLIIGGAVTLITLNAITASEQAELNVQQFENAARESRRIHDGLEDGEVLISDDGQVGNPNVYPDMGCELPDYQSKDGRIYAVARNGTKIPVGIKGVNWFGMETSLALVSGLWENPRNGTTVFEIATFLARNRFNSVRLPLSIRNILDDTPPEESLINTHTNRAINITSYITTIQTLVQALGFRHISVMLSLHTLQPTTPGGAWFDERIGLTENQYLQAVDILTQNLCDPLYWNILGLDLKNEPHECSWGGEAPDWQQGATLIGNRMLEGCPNWLAFVEGIASNGTITLQGREDTYYDWWGGGFANASGNPPTFDVPNKLVRAPHYSNSGSSPVWYLYASGTPNAEGGLDDYVELDDDTLRYNVEATMERMFGYLLTTDTNSAMVIGEFAGLYATDAHPLLTTRRTTDFTIEVMLRANFTGGYMRSLNPERAYQYNPADTLGHFTEGLLETDWLTPNRLLIDGIAALDEMENLRMFPCFEILAESTTAAE